MSAHTIELTESDAKRLRQLLACLAERPRADRDTREWLRHKLDHARIVAPGQVAPHVVTLQSRAVLADDETWELMTYTLVHPEQVDHNANTLSILTPMGLAMLGHREGDLVEWGTTDARHRIRIRRVLYQPEAAGHEHIKYAMRRRTDDALGTPAGRPKATNGHRDRPIQRRRAS
jgi:regulator of nucleoside diphosphate kinase